MYGVEIDEKLVEGAGSVMPAFLIIFLIVFLYTAL